MLLPAVAGIVHAHRSAEAAKRDFIVEGTAVVESSDLPASCWVASPKLAGPTVVVRMDDMLLLELDKAWFLGVVDDDGRFEVTTRPHVFKFSDGCTWEATDTVRGRLTPEGFVADHSYVEAPLSEGRCASPCNFDSKIRVRL